MGKQALYSNLPT